ncbi:MAG: asparagine synthase (glutamine-hydrolyzing) [Patescibacteria group bacterium]
MCGISGIVSFEKKEQKEIEHAIERMDESQALRGPDDRGVFLFSNGGFGHRRLSIIDLSKDGHQPMEWRNVSGAKISVTFNGEIYNFRELKKELENLGISFHTNSDTEVILAGYEKWGIKMVKKLRGMFAFGLWDEERQKLFLVRDRYGIKPLYYYFDKEKVVFASTVKAIEKSGEINIEKNNEASIGFLLFGSVPLPHTTLKNVYAVPASNYIEVDASGNKKIAQYYNPLDFYINKSSDTDPIVISKKIRTLLEDSIRGHLISDAPIGVFLSGGLDSSALTALASSELNQHSSAKISIDQRESVKTLSVHFEEEEFSEKRYQDMVAKKIGSAHREILITKEGFYKTLDEFWKSMDQPSIDGINSYMISEAARQAGLTVVLSGLGSDEIFLGYTNFRKAGFIRKIQKLPKVVKLPLLFLGSIFGGKYRKLSYLRSESILEFYLLFRGIFLPSEVAKVLGISEKSVWSFIKKLENELLVTNYNLLVTLSPADLLSYLDFTLYMQNQLLKDTDVMSMAHSIEVRVPFLDHPLVEYISSLPAELKLSGEYQKQFLIDATKDIIPSEVWDRPKMGFTFPLQKWLTGRLLVTDYKLPVTKFHWSQNWAIEVLKKFS